MSLSLVSDLPSGAWVEAYKRMCNDNRDLRRELQDAICDRNAADSAARVAKDIFDVAKMRRSRQCSREKARSYWRSAKAVISS